jgi:uncharacterized membrane protein
VSRRDRADEEAAARVLRDVAAQAARRLAWIEWVIYGAAAVLAVAAGALVALLVTRPLGLPFRPTWMVASMLLFVVPAFVSFRRERRARRSRLSPNTDESDV